MINKTQQRNRIKEVSFFLLLLCFGSILKAQTFFIDSAAVHIESGAVVYVEGEILSQASGTVDNSGELVVTGDFTNNAGNNFFINNSPGKVVMAGTNQLIQGSSSTLFHDLSLDSTGTKTLAIDAFVDGTLDLWNSILNTNAVFLNINNTDTAAITRDTLGMIASFINGAVIWNMDTALTYHFPVGGISPLRYRPIDIRPTTNAMHSFRVRLANNSPDNEGYLVTSKQASLCKVNTNYFHEIRMVTGSGSSDLTMYYDTAADGNFNTIAHWQNVPEWQNTGTAIKNLNMPPQFSSLRINGWIAFSPAPFALSAIGGLFNIGPDSSKCAPDSAIYDAGPGYLSYLWSDSTNGQTLVVDSTTTIWVSVEDSNGCSYTDSADVVISGPPAVNIGPDTTMCSNDSLFMDAGNPGATYAWSTGDTSQTVKVAGGGTYYVDVTNAAGCTESDTLELTAIPAPVVNLGLDTNICVGDTVILDANNPGLTTTWSTGDTTQTINVFTTGTYYVDVSDSNCSASDTILINVLATPNASFFADTSNDPTVDFTDLSTGSPNSWSWDFGDGNTSSSQSPQHTYANPGTYTVTLVVDNGCGKDTSTRAVTVTAVGVNDPFGYELKIWPNPTNSMINVELEGANVESIQVIDAFGRILAHREYKGWMSYGKDQFDLASYSKGTYWIKTNVTGTSLLRKVVLQ